MYAILNDDNVCVMMSVTKEGYVNYVKTNVNRLGKKYENGEWADIPKEEPPLSETDKKLLQIQATVDYLAMMSEN